jgi:hypothetical protein
MRASTVFVLRVSYAIIIFSPVALFVAVVAAIIKEYLK